MHVLVLMETNKHECYSLSIAHSLLVGGSAFVDGDGAVPGATSNGVEFQVLLEGLARARRQRKTLLLVMHSQEVEGWDEDD